MNRREFLKARERVLALGWQGVLLESIKRTAEADSRINRDFHKIVRGEKLTQEGSDGDKKSKKVN